MIIKHIEDTTFQILMDLNIKEAKDIDVFNIANFLSVDVQPAQLDTDISGLFVIKDRKPYIRYNESEGKTRQRFTIAHELGHFLLHKDTPLFVDKNEKVMFRNAASATGEINKEREANAFAAALLMPKKFIEVEIQNMPMAIDSISYLSDIFNVSTGVFSKLCQAKFERVISFGFFNQNL